MTPAMLDGLVRIISLGIPQLNPYSLRFCRDGTLAFVTNTGSDDCSTSDSKFVSFNSATAMAGTPSMGVGGVEHHY